MWRHSENTAQLLLFLDLISEGVQWDTSIPSADPPHPSPPPPHPPHTLPEGSDCIPIQSQEAVWPFESCLVVRKHTATPGSRPAQSHETQRRPTPPPTPQPHEPAWKRWKTHTFIHIVLVNVIVVRLLDKHRIGIALKCVKMAPSPVKMSSKKKNTLKKSQ